MNDLESRVQHLELAVLALAAEAEQEFGDSPGHDFRGNQWTSGGTGAGRSSVMQSREDREKNRDPNAYKGRAPEPKPAPVQTPKPLKPLTEKQTERQVAKAQRDLQIAIDDTIRDNPEYHPDQIAHDLAHAVALDMHPDAKKEFFRREGFGTETLEFGDVEGHPFHGNQWTVHNASEDRQAVLKDALKGPVPSLSDEGGKAFMLRAAAELDKAGLGRSSTMNGGDLRGWTESQGSIGFALRPASTYDGKKWNVDPSRMEAHLVLSGENAGLKYSEHSETNSVGDMIDLHTPNDPQSVRDKIQGVFEDKLGMKVTEVRQTGHQMHWDDDVDYTVTMKTPAGVDPSAEAAAPRIAAERAARRRGY